MSVVHHGQLHDRRPAKPESIPSLRRAVVDFAAANGASEQQLENIALAVSEAVSNAVLHAYIEEECPGTVAVEAKVEGRALDIVIADDGRGLLPRTDSPGIGLGLALIERITEQLKLEQSGQGVRLRMKFPLR
ncbi:MAG TPA: ATP-binding protein [Solirubrobacteraceae bacterium]|nr:ATP-binding protein [Solirubrobacteraceae bacterium]